MALAFAARGGRVVKLSFYPRGARARTVTARRGAVVPPLFRRRLRMSTFTGRSQSVSQSVSDFTVPPRALHAKSIVPTGIDPTQAFIG